MREMSVAEQRYEAVRAVIADGETVTQVARRLVDGELLFAVLAESARATSFAFSTVS